MFRVFFIWFIFLFCNPVFAETGDQLIVEDDLVNLREGPSQENAVLRRLEKNTGLIEINRKDSWIEVRVNSESAITGWIHSSLVKKIVIEKPVEKAGKEDLLAIAFKKFRKEFEKMSARLELEYGNPVFTSVEYAGNGAIRVVATDVWLDYNRVLREKHLADIFSLWDKEVGVGLPASVDIVNDKNERFLFMYR